MSINEDRKYLVNRIETNSDCKQATQNYLNSLYTTTLERLRLTKDPVNIWCLQGDLNRIIDLQEVFNK